MNQAAANVMVTVAEIAERDGMTRQAVSKQVRKLAENGMPVERDTRGRISKFSQAWYDDHRSQFADPTRSTAPDPGEEKQVDSFEEAKRREMWLRVDREELKKQQLAGSLVRKDLLEEALDQIGAAIQSVVSKLPNRADELAAAVSKEGVHGLRLELRKIAYNINVDVADAVEKIAVEAPASDPLIESEKCDCSSRRAQPCRKQDCGTDPTDTTCAVP